MSVEPVERRMISSDAAPVESFVTLDHTSPSATPRVAKSSAPKTTASITSRGIALVPRKTAIDGVPHLANPKVRITVPPKRSLKSVVQHAPKTTEAQLLASKTAKTLKNKTILAKTAAKTTTNATTPPRKPLSALLAVDETLPRFESFVTLSGVASPVVARPVATTQPAPQASRKSAAASAAKSGTRPTVTTTARKPVKVVKKSGELGSRCVASKIASPTKTSSVRLKEPGVPAMSKVVLRSTKKETVKSMVTSADDASDSPVEALISLNPQTLAAAKKMTSSSREEAAARSGVANAPESAARRVDLEMPVSVDALEDAPENIDGVVGEPLPYAEGEPVWEASLSACLPACDTIGPKSPCPVYGFHCVGCAKCRGRHCGGQKKGRDAWAGAGPIPWEMFAQGEYVGPARSPHVPEYRLRVDDLIDFTYRLTREPSNHLYRLEVGDRLMIESLTTPEHNREVLVEPDGRVTAPLLGQLPAAGLTMAELRDKLQALYAKEIREPRIQVSPIEINSRLQELRAVVDNRYGRGGQASFARVTPAGTIQLPAIGSVYVQGLTLQEVKREVEACYRKVVEGMGVTPILGQRAPRYIYVVGEVKNPGRFDLTGPTTLMQSVALAGSWNVGANLRHVVVFRRDENWNLMATKLDIHDALFGKHPCPADEIWLRDSDIVVVPKRAVLAMDDTIELLFTRGLYGVFPVNFNYILRTASGLSTL